MKLPCEVAVKSVVPAIRALLARELTETHQMKQSEVAQLLGITQTAVSKYKHRVRGRVLLIENEDVRTLIVQIATSMFNNGMERTTLALNICNACKAIRKKRLMCELCKKADPTVDMEECQLCLLSSCAPSPPTSPKEHI